MKHPFSREAFTDWVGKQPKGRTYDFLSCECAIYQYVEKALGITDPDEQGKAYCKISDDVALHTACIPYVGKITGKQVQSFGRLHERLLTL